MKVALFIPCYIDQFYPGVGIATLELLERLGVTVSYPEKQTCCGQPMANAGFEHLTGACNDHFIENFSGYDYIVSPSGSCVLHVKEHLHSDSLANEAMNIRTRVFELTEFLVDVVNLEEEAETLHAAHVQQEPACDIDALSADVQMAGALLIRSAT